MRRTRARSLSRTLVAIIGGVSAAAVIATTAGANITITTLAQENFTGATTSLTWVLPSTPGTSNGACLTAGESTGSVPGCDFATPDPSGSGALQLTTNQEANTGSVFSPTSVPLGEGVDVTFDSYQYNGTGSDGIAFVFTATDPTDPSAPSVTGEPGGTLGYSSIQQLGGIQQAGLTNGYLGFGLDAFGNYEAERVGLNGCGGPGYAPESVTVRGPGDGLNGYCVLGTTSVSLHDKSLDAPSATSRADAVVPVEIALNPTDGTVTAPESGLPIPADSWLIAYSPVGVTQTTGDWSATYSLTGQLPTTVAGPGYNAELANSSDFPTSWIDGATGEPYQLGWGITGSTGSDTEIHEVTNLTVSSLVGPDPQLSLTNTNDVNGHLIAGNRAVYTLTPTVTATADEGQPLTLTDTFPSGVVPGQPTSTSPNWTCGTPAGQTISCVYTPTGTIAAGTTLPAVTVPVTIATTARGAKTAAGVISSNDAQPAAAANTGIVSVLTTSSSPHEAIGGAKITLTLSGVPASDYGAVVRMKKGGTVLCTFTYTATVHSCVVKGLPAGTYSTVTADLGAHGNFSAQNVPVPKFILNPNAEVIVHYANNSPQLTSATKAQIAFFVKEIKKYELTKVTVTGYASSTGSASANKSLAKNRANIAAAYLRTALAADHVAHIQIVVTSKGASDFVAQPPSSPLNRRTTLIAT